MIGKTTHRMMFVAVSLLALALLIGMSVFAIRFSAGPRATFRRLAIRPIPQSVHRMKMDQFQITPFSRQPDMYCDRAVVLRFDISREDLLQIVRAREFKPSASSMWFAGSAVWETGDQTAYQTLHTVEVYKEKRREPPHWFDLEKWANPETYFLEQPDSDPANWTDVTLVFYNEELGIAYLIKWERRLP